MAPPSKKQKTSRTRKRAVASTARSKPGREASRSDHSLRRLQAADPRIAKIEEIYDGLSWLNLSVETVDAAVHQHKAALSAVYNTLELFECILSHMTNRQLVLATGVCRGWRKFIFDSPTLRKKLFLEPDLRPAQHCRLFMDDPQIAVSHPTGYLYMVPGEDDAAEGNTDEEMTDWPDDQVQEIYEEFRVEPSLAKRYKIVNVCPMLEPEGGAAEEIHRKPAFVRKIRGLNRRRAVLEDWEWDDWKLKKGWAGWESELLRSRALNSGTWRQMFLTAPPVDRVVVGFEWIGHDSEGALASIKGNRVIERPSGIRCECLLTVYLDLEGDLEVFERPSVARERLERTTLQTKHNVTVRKCLTELEFAGFKMKQKFKNIYSATMSGVVIPTPAELVAMQRPIEVLRLEHDSFHRQQEFDFIAREKRADGEDFDDDHCMESLPLEVRYPEESAEWEERVEQAEMFQARASRRSKK